MRSLARRASLALAAGAFGALVNSAALQLLRLARPESGIPAWSPGWIYPRVVWGALFGLLLLLPILRRRSAARGALVSLAPSAARLTLFAPAGGVGGAVAVAMVFLFNAVWGVAAALWLDWTGGSGGRGAAS